MSKLSENKIICITGNIGSGKSKVSEILRAMNYAVYDLDFGVKQLYEDKKIVRTVNKLLFQEESDVFQKDKISQLIFSDEKMRKKLENYIHPLIKENMKKFIATQSTLCFVEMALVFEQHWEHLFDKIICVVVEEKIANTRLIQYRNFTMEEIEKRRKAQYSIQYKMQHSDYILDNNKDIQYLQQQITHLIGELNNEK